VSVLSSDQGLSSGIGLTSTELTMTHELTECIIIVVLASVDRASVRLDYAAHAAPVVLVQAAQVLLVKFTNLHGGKVASMAVGGASHLLRALGVSV
jgi:hypothetical protein